MLAASDLVAFVPTRDPEAARAFYQQVLGLPLLSADAFASVFDANGVALRIVNVSQVSGFSPASYTVLGWRVPDLGETIGALVARGVQFQRFPGMEQDELGVWNAPSGDRVAWFKDPDGNLLSLTQE